MDEDEERLVAVRADIGTFRRDMGVLRDLMTGTLADGAEAAGRGISQSLARAARSGRVEFEDLGRIAAKALGEVAVAALRLGQGPSAGSGLGAVVASAAANIFGLPGRATGGPVGPDRPYLVGERGPELFVPTAAGRVEPLGASARGPDIRVTVNVSAAGEMRGESMARTGRQVAREVARVLDSARRRG